MQLGKAVDNRRFKATGFRFTHTTRETILALRRHLKLAPLAPIGPRAPTATNRRSRSSCA